MSSPSVRPRLALLLLLAASVSGASPAFPREADDPGGAPRHTELESAVPGDGAVVEGAVDQLLLRFSTPVQLPVSRVVLTGADGQVVAGSLDLVDSAAGRELRYALVSPLGPGGYRVEWQTAGPDSHVIRGAFTFQVAGAVPPGAGAGVDQEGAAGDTAAVASGGDPGAPVEVSDSAGGSGTTSVAIRWLLYLGMTLVIGAVSFRLAVVPFVLRKAPLAAAGATISKRLATLTWVGIAVLVLTLPARLWSQSLAIWGQDSLAAGNLGTLIFRTPWGWGWLLQIVAILLAGFGLRLAAPGGTRRRGWSLVAGGALALAFVPALSGHAWGIDPRLLGIVFSGAHVLAAGAWMGGLAALLLAGLPAVRTAGSGEEGPPGLVTVVEAFSRMALVAVLVLVAAGVGQNIFLLGSPGNLVSTGWGRTLLVKLGLLAAAGALGLYNWRVVRPALRETPRPGLLRIPATVELLLGLAILAATAVLVSRPLP